MSANGLFEHAKPTRFGPAPEKRRRAVNAHNMRRKAEAAERLFDFAGHIAEGASISAAARAVGVSQQRGSNMMRELIERYGAGKKDPRP